MYFSPGPSPGRVRDLRGLPERQLEAAQAVAQGGGVVVPEPWRPGGDQAGQRLDQGASLVEVLVVGQVLGQPQLDGGRAHQVYGGRADHLDRRNLGDVARLSLMGQAFHDADGSIRRLGL